MATRTGGALAVLFHQFTHGTRLGVFVIFLERRNVWRRRRRRRAENVLQYPFAAQHRRSAVGVRSDRENTALTKQPHPSLISDRDAAEPASVNVRDAVVP